MLLRPPPPRLPSRALLLDSYQHLVLACLVGLLLCTTATPSGAVLVVTVTQMWRLHKLRREGVPTPAPDMRAATHRAGYFQTAQMVSGLLAGALFASFVFDSLQGLQALMGGALVWSLLLLWQSYGVLRRDAQEW